MPERETPRRCRALEAAGYANVGKTNLHEFAYGVTSMNPHFGTVPNPRAPGTDRGRLERRLGRRARGRARGRARSARDTGGSIRIPAACCGIVGFKPTYGLVPLDGCFPLAPSYDHAGPMARTVADCAAMMDALGRGFDAARSIARGVGSASRGSRGRSARARPRRGGGRAVPDAAPVAFPNAERHLPVLHARGRGRARDLFAEHADSYGEDVASKIERCLAVTDAETRRGGAPRASSASGRGAARGLDLLLTPTGVRRAALPADDSTIRGHVRFTYPFNALGWPALALPCGPAEDGLPASVQLVGRPGADALVLAAGAGRVPRV